MKAALFHVEFDVVQRSREQNAVKVACYNAAARVRLSDGTSYNFSRKRAEHRGHVVMLPAGAPDWARDAGKLWVAAESAERQKNGQPARLVEFSIPREIPESEWMAFSQAIVEPWVKDGMAAQVDIHVITGSDGLPQPHCHVLLTMRRFDADGSLKGNKVREWNTDFTRRADDGTGKMKKGQQMRGLVAGRMNDWMARHGIEARVDHRKAVARGDDPPPEPNVSKRSWEAHKRRPDSPAAAPVREVLEARQARRQLRQAQRAATYYEAAAKATAAALDEARPGIKTPVRRRKDNRLAWDDAWSPPIGGDVLGVDIGERYAVIQLFGGAALVDNGRQVVIRGKVTDRALAALADHAVRRGYQSVEVTGDAVFRAKLTAALAARGIEATNEAKPSAYALSRAQEVLAARQPRPAPTVEPKPSPTKAEARKPKPPRPQEPEPAAPSYSTAYVPPWAKRPGWQTENNNKKEGSR